MKVATLEKFHLRWGSQDSGDPGVGKVRRGEGFFFLQEGGWGGGELTLDDTMNLYLKIIFIEYLYLEINRKYEYPHEFQTVF